MAVEDQLKQRVLSLETRCKERDEQLSNSQDKVRRY